MSLRKAYHRVRMADVTDVTSENSSGSFLLSREFFYALLSSLNRPSLSMHAMSACRVTRFFHKAKRLYGSLILRTSSFGRNIQEAIPEIEIERNKNYTLPERIEPVEELQM